ncbi:ATP-dependent helicase [Spirochaeta cellobiosiphila]|uniref:ATP-dependent helicase n=1 Tax=Spirochaeta cellobiosiphila TaxID=504483 RepID=UPI000403400B|nr:UvrD-helicase domain-containing protein [Spirochaeta cellobiosiphila]
MIYNLKNELNDKQYEAATTIDGPLLLIAGAGSGKTRVITFRIANMLAHGIHQSSILALTFTNKAAKEMSERVKDLTGRKLSNLTVSTFHSFGVQVLRESITKLGYRPNFTIYDAVDKISLLKEAARELNLVYEPQELQNIGQIFSGLKTWRTSWSEVDGSLKPLYEEYEDHLKTYNAVDFDDLIVKPVQLFENFPEVLESYQKRFTYVMVDEFQDTSIAQYKMMKYIALGSRNICVVGDDDQSIYSWRGANYENILQFEREFHELKEIRLEQNYRSTGMILNAANAVIANNTNRKDKVLWTGMEGGASISLNHPESELKEGEFIAETIKTLAFREGIRYGDVGILVRTNSLTKSIEVALLTENIPYRVSGGTSFFQRKEIKDIISYLRIIYNPDDDVNLLRVINTPRRGIGKRSLQTINAIANTKSSSLYSSIYDLTFASDTPIGSTMQGSLSEFIELIEEYKDRFNSKDKLADTLRDMVESIDYWGHLIQENPKSDKAARWKYQNLESFISILEDWENNPDVQDKSLGAFLNRITLITRDDVSDDSEDHSKVNLMTVHASKGLEFKVVFLAGVEEGIIPHQRSLEEGDGNVEEERRLFYVAITRAREQLFMTACRTRRSMNETIEPAASPFLDEIPTELIQYHEFEDYVDVSEAKDLFKDLKKRFS